MINEYYYVAFMPTEDGAYKLFEKEGFNHCIVFFPVDGYAIEDAENVAIVSHNKSFVSLGIINKEVFLRYIRKGFYIKVKTNFTVKASLFWWSPTPNTCVTITKQLLGIQKAFILTPYQLYKYIIRGQHGI